MPPRHFFGRRLDNGTWTGLLGMLNRKVRRCNSGSDSVLLLVHVMLYNGVYIHVSVAAVLLLVFALLLLPPQEVDMGGTTVTVSDQRLQAIDPSVPIFMDLQTLVYKRPVFESDLAGFIKPFSPQVRTRSARRTRTKITCCVV